MTIKLSIIVPIYNVEAYLFKCLESITNQTLKEFEVILVDDGSKDQSSVIAQKFVRDDARFKYFFKANGGLSDARNFGIVQAKGEFIAFVDGDDYISEQFVEFMLQKQLETQANIVVCDMAYVYDSETKFSSGGNFSLVYVKDNLQYLNMNNSACNKIYHRELFEQHRFPKGKLYEDLFIVPILLYEANCVAHVEAVLYYYVQRGGSIVHQVNPRIFDIYDAITHLKDSLSPRVNQKESLFSVIHHMYIEHGLYLTTLRIKDSVDIKNQGQYFEQNMKKLEHCYPNWQEDVNLKQYPFKQRVMFTLLALRLYSLVAFLFRKRLS
jgi:glycosyltransferase involved in cell wall biosynthesis